MNMNEVLSRFSLKGRPTACTPYGNGHIHRTWRVETDSGAAYILQRINETVFPDVPALMENIARVTDYLHGQGLEGRRALTLVPTADGERWLRISGDDGERAGAYRVYVFIRDSLCLDRAEEARDFRESGAAFGSFQMQMKDFPAQELREILPGFHDTAARCARLRRAVQADPLGRAASAAREIDGALRRAEGAGEMLEMLDRGELPLRATHNDTKLNNVLLDACSRRALCVIDLDTVMPGLSGNDFGDSIRFGANTGAEDERDLERVGLSMVLFEAYAGGFLAACGEALCPAELETLPLAAELMTFECGVRFLTDYLEGDAYFRIHRPLHNLERARAQLHLAADMARRRDEMRKAIRRLSPRRF